METIAIVLAFALDLVWMIWLVAVAWRKQAMAVKLHAR
jgi:hypothetical protein